MTTAADPLDASRDAVERSLMLEAFNIVNSGGINRMHAIDRIMAKVDAYATRMAASEVLRTKTELQVNDQATPIKRGPGRPRKTPPPAATLPDDVA